METVGFSEIAVLAALERLMENMKNLIECFLATNPPM